MTLSPVNALKSIFAFCGNASKCSSLLDIHLLPLARLLLCDSSEDISKTLNMPLHQRLRHWSRNLICIRSFGWPPKGSFQMALVQTILFVRNASGHSCFRFSSAYEFSYCACGWYFQARILRLKVGEYYESQLFEEESRELPDYCGPR